MEYDCKTEVLERGTKPVTRTFGVMAYVVCIDSINLANKDVLMKKICAKNAATILGLEIKWIRWLSNLAPGKKQLSLVVEYKITIQVKKAIHEDLSIRTELHWCTMYNVTCK